MGTWFATLRSYNPWRTEESSTDPDPNIDHSNAENKGYKLMIQYHNELVAALSTESDLLSIAGALLSREFISAVIFDNTVQHHFSTPIEKAITVVKVLRERIKIAPQQFPELMQIFSEHTSTKCIAARLLSQYTHKGEVVDTACHIICAWFMQLHDHKYYSLIIGNVISDKDDFSLHLKTLYARLTPTQVSANTWPPSATHKVFNLAMIKSISDVRRGQIEDKFVQKTITGRVDDILEEKYSIQLKNIFKETKGTQRVVLVEGPPGCGKTTLSVYISQQWGEGKLFTEFKYVILIQLRDPEVQAASCIADLLPARNDEMRQQADR